LPALHIQNLSNHCRHKYDTSISRFFKNLIFGGFVLFGPASKLGTDKGGTRQLFSDQGVCVMGKSRRICPSTLNFHTQLLPRLNQQAAAAAAAAFASRLLLATTQGTYVATIGTWLLDKYYLLISYSVF
jgi:hypothetical protein